jgi:N-hydroxyarylamine O-acetyltransferase
MTRTPNHADADGDTSTSSADGDTSTSSADGDASESTSADASTPLSAGDLDRYLTRIGLDPATVRDASADHELLTTLQRAHATSVPFETLSITGDPFGQWDGSGVTLTVPDLFEKIVTDERGGYCFELNGLFTVLLRALGFDADRAAAMVLSDDGDPSPPANHHTIVVDLDRRYVADVGTGTPKTRCPVPLDGDPATDDLGTTWRVVESERPDSEYLLQYRRSGGDSSSSEVESETAADGDAEWNSRYVFDDVPRELDYFAATCEYLATAPESTFTGDPILSVGTADGHVELSLDTLTRVADGEETNTTVGTQRWYELVRAEFGLAYPFC